MYGKVTGDKRKGLDEVDVTVDEKESIESFIGLKESVAEGVKLLFQRLDSMGLTQALECIKKFPVGIASAFGEAVLEIEDAVTWCNHFKVRTLRWQFD